MNSKQALTLKYKDIHREMKHLKLTKLSYKKFRAILMNLFYEIRKYLVKGHTINIPYWGKLTWFEYDGWKNPLQPSIMWYIKAHNTWKKWEKYRFKPTKNFIREHRNNYHSTTYKIYNYEKDSRNSYWKHSKVFQDSI